MKSAHSSQTQSVWQTLKKTPKSLLPKTIFHRLFFYSFRSSVEFRSIRCSKKKINPVCGNNWVFGGFLSIIPCVTSTRRAKEAKKKTSTAFVYLWFSGPKWIIRLFLPPKLLFLLFSCALEVCNEILKRQMLFGILTQREKKSWLLFAFIRLNVFFLSR